MRVVVAGGGIGGLVLAQGLRRRGVDVVVLERDTDLADTGGYRLHLGPRACEVLRRELPPRAWKRLSAAAPRGDAVRAMHVTDRRLRLLLPVPFEGEPHLLVGRRPLRLLLGEGLEGALRLGATVTAWSTHGDGVDVVTGGGDVRADLLVAADGTGSVVARQAAGRPTSAPLGLVGLAGRLTGLDPWDAEAPAYLRHGPALAIGPRGVGMFVTRHDTDGDLEPPGWVWGLILARPTSDVAPVTSEEAVRHLAGWSSWIRALVESTPADELGHYRFHAADPRAGMLGWGSGKGVVTGLGDAVHAMPPTGGQSAATAIEDAGDLLRALDQVAGGATLGPALAAYEAGVARRGRARVRESLTPARWIGRTRGPLASTALLGVTSAVALGRRAARRSA